jgi:hypothetical protein
MFTCIKRRALHLIHSSIARLWVGPLEDRIIPGLEKNPGWLSKKLICWASWGANAGRVMVNELRLSKKRWVGPHWSVTYLGNEKSSEFFCCNLFPTPPEEVESKNIFLWQAPGLIRKQAEEGDLVVCELNQVVNYSSAGIDRLFTTPREIQMVIEGFDRPMDEILAGFQQQTRKRVSQLEAQGYSYCPTHSEADFEMFYQRMYLPHILGRHSGRGLDLSDHDLMLRYFKEGVLILVCLDGVPIAGGILILNGDLCLALELGVLDGQYEWVKRGCNNALYWFSMQWAHERGARKFALGQTFPLNSNGPLMYKRQWGARVHRDTHNHLKWSFYGNKLPDGLRSHLTDLGFISELDGNYYQALLPNPAEPVDGEKLSTHLLHLSRFGVAGLMSISADGEKRLIMPDAVREDQSGRRYLAVPHLAAH